MTSLNIYNIFDIYFTKNKYTNIYLNLCQKANQRAITKKLAQNIVGYVETHHVIPVSIDPSLSKLKDNLVHLSAREHFIAHKLLIKIVKSEYKIKMINAVLAFQRCNNIQQRNLKSKDYDYFRQMAIIANTAENNPRFGKIGTLKDKKAITNGNETKYINQNSSLIDGWEFGSHKKSYKIYNNTEFDICVYNNEVIPNGFILGSIRKGKGSSLKGKKLGNYSNERINNLKQSLQDFKFYTNGIIDIKIKNGDVVPENFKPGRTNGQLSDIVKNEYIKISLNAFGFSSEDDFKSELEFCINEQKMCLTELNKKFIKKTDDNNINGLSWWLKKFSLVPIKGKRGPKKQKLD